MKDGLQTRRGGQYWLTRSQAGALGVGALSLAALTFFLGLVAGRQQSQEAAAADREMLNLIAAEVESDSLTELLARVEANIPSASPSWGEAHAGQLTYPDVLPGDEARTLVPNGAGDVAADVVVDAPAAGLDLSPPPADAAAPTSGWAVEIERFDDMERADERVASLREAGVEAYRIDERATGGDVHCVRVGAFDTKAEAATAVGDLRVALGLDDLVVARLGGREE